MITVDEFIPYYYGIKLHFKSQNYNGVKYNFKIKTPENRKDYDKIKKSLKFVVNEFNKKGLDSRKLKYFFIVCFLNEKSITCHKISNNFNYHFKLYEKHKSNIDLIEKHFEQSLILIKKNFGSFDNIVHNTVGDIPIILDMLSTGMLSYESYMILDRICNLEQKLNNLWEHNIVWQDKKFLIQKYLVIFGDIDKEPFIKKFNFYFGKIK